MKEHFSLSTKFGMYYDEPEKLKDQRMARGIIGILVNSGENLKIPQFIKQNPLYTHSKIPSVKGIICKPFIFRNILSYIIFYSKFSSKIKAYKNQHSNDFKEDGGVIFLYHATNTQAVGIYGPGVKQYQLSKIPAPEKK